MPKPLSRWEGIIGGIILLHFIILVWTAWHLPIGPHEAKLYFTQGSLVGYLMHLGQSLAPQSDFINLRAPFLLIHLLNLALFYHLCLTLLRKKSQRVVAFLIFLFLPGIISSAILASHTGIVLALYQTFLLLFLHQKRGLTYAILPLFLLVDKSCVIFYFALLTYGLWHRDRWLLGLTTLLFGAALQQYGIALHGKPVNHFFDTIGLYAAIFSPFLFLYFFYAMYRILLKGKKDIIWHLSFTILLLSLIISLRQRVPIADFAPYVIVAITLMVGLFFRSYHVRLPQFRKGYTAATAIVLSTLIINATLLLFHRPLFLVIEPPKHHFAAPFYFPYWCAQKLKKEGIKNIRCHKGDICWQLRYYNIVGQGAWVLNPSPSSQSTKVTIRYKGKPMTQCYVSKINTSTESNPIR